MSVGSVLVVLLGNERKPDRALLSKTMVPLYALLMAIYWSLQYEKQSSSVSDGVGR